MIAIGIVENQAIHRLCYKKQNNEKRGKRQQNNYASDDCDR